MQKFEPQFSKERPNRLDREVYAACMAEFNAQPDRVRRRVPYVLLGHISVERNTAREQPEMYLPMLHKLQVTSIHGTETDLKRYTDRGWIVLDYWLPEPEQAPLGITRGDVTVKSGWGLDWRTEEGRKRVADLRAAILRAKGETDMLFGFRERELSLTKKLADAEARAAKAEAKKGA